MLRKAQHSGLLATPVHVIKKTAGQSITLEKCTGQRNVSRPGVPSESDKVILTIHLKEDSEDHSLVQWRHWLTGQLPRNIEGIDVEVIAAHQSNSINLLVAVPTWLWTCISPDTEAIRFVAHVEGRSILPADHSLPSHLKGWSGPGRHKTSVSPGSQAGHDALARRPSSWTPAKDTVS